MRPREFARRVCSAISDVSAVAPVRTWSAASSGALLIVENPSTCGGADGLGACSPPWAARANGALVCSGACTGEPYWIDSHCQLHLRFLDESAPRQGRFVVWGFNGNSS